MREDRARPFLKFAGGKRALLPQVLPHVPEDFYVRSDAAYFEPFVGGGAMLFHLRPKRAVIGDANLRLVRAYIAIRSHVDRVVSALRHHEARHCRDYFYEVRRLDVDLLKDDVEVAAWLIYLNKTCFNGLYRVNASGRFNVPIGRYDKPIICDEANLRLCSSALGSVDIYARDFEDTLAGATAGDFAYLDPPYVPTGGEAKFTSYTAGGFGLADQERLRDIALDLKRRGCCIVLHNSDTALARKLYDHPKFIVRTVSRSGAISAKKDKRQRVQEILVT